MSNENDKLLERHLRGESPYTDLYRKLDADDVPAEMDRAVLNEARRAIEKRRHFVWRQFAPALAVAATAVLTVSIVMRSGLQSEKAESLTDAGATQLTTVELMQPPSVPKMEAPPSLDAPRPNVEIAPQASPAAPAPSAPPELRAKALQDAPMRAEAPPLQERAVAKVAESPPPATRQLEEVMVTGQLVRTTPEDAALPVEVVSEPERRRATPRAGPRETVRVRNAERQSAAEARARDPKLWLDDIRELRDQGQTRAADEEWRRFIEAHPNYIVAADDRARPR